MQTTAAAEARRNGGWVPVHCMGLVAYRGRMFAAATFDRRTADATINERAE
jgi:hypothetical protein